MKNERFGKLRAISAAILVLALALSLLGAAAAETYAVVRDTNSLNLRAAASTAGKLLGAYPRGTWVAVTGEQNNFYAVATFDGKTGYMSKNFLYTSDQLTFGKVAVVNNPKATAYLNLRSYPSYAASVITILYNGVPLNVLNESNGWFQVQMGETRGYVRSEFTWADYQPLGQTVATIKTPNNTAVNLRTAPNSGAQVLQQFDGDRYVSVLYEGTNWWYVSIDKYLGYISSDFLVEGLCAERDEAWRQEEDQGGSGSGIGTVTDAYATVTNPVSTQKLNLRTQPSTASGIVSRLTNGTRLTVLIQGTEWCKVYVEQIAATGYVMTRYLTYHNLPATPLTTLKHPQGSYVDLRSAASMTSTVLAQVPSGSVVTILSPGQDWMKVNYEGITGYVIGYFTTALQ